MKNWLVTMLLLNFCLSGQSQVLDEWTNQSATQKKYLVQQIASLKVYIDYLEKGYNITEKGLNTISDLKNGHLNLDQDFFASLQNINPKVGKYGRVADVFAINSKIIKSYKSMIKSAGQYDYVNSDEINYINKVFNALIEGCTDLTNEMMTLITAGKLEMSDDERIKRIDKIYDNMRERLVFVDTFSSELKILSIQREHEAGDVKSTKALFAN